MIFFKAKESTLILMQTVPMNLNVEKLKQKFIDNVSELFEMIIKLKIYFQVDDILAVHDFHIWRLTKDEDTIATAHILCYDLVAYQEIAEKAKIFFHNEGIHKTTIQPEFVVHPQNVNYFVFQIFNTF